MYPSKGKIVYTTEEDDRFGYKHWKERHWPVEVSVEIIMLDGKQILRNAGFVFFLWKKIDKFLVSLARFLYKYCISIGLV